ncbi:MAG: type III pantothenate kinase [Bacteroidales bacterium]|nr:type III pantothenate kinase [Bacteroidales bacterium]
MSNYLAVDIGNTLQKAAVFSTDGRIIELKEEPNLPLETVADMVSTFNIRAAIISNVGEKRDDITSYLSDHSQLVQFSHNTPLPIQIDYATPGTLGLDRIANAVAAHTQFPHNHTLSIQAGTCLVIDFVTEDGRYLGGSISPGLEMRMKALQHFTQRLPKVEKRQISIYIGSTTEESILAGVINGLSDEINGAIHRYSMDFDNLKVILTGGNKEDLQNSIKYSIFAASNFVLIGLYKILIYNVKGLT